MPTDPDNDRYPLPFDRYDYGWDDEMCNIMDQLAMEVPKKGALANRPAADDPLAPHYYYSTDQTPVLFSVNVNESWTDIELGGGGGGGDGSFSGSHTDLTNVTSGQHHEWPVSAGSLTFDPATQSELDNHTSNISNPHDVSASQVGAIADSPGTVTQTNLSFDTATQGELDSHTTNEENPHSVTASQAGAIPDTSGTVTTSNLATASVTPVEIDGSGGSSGQALVTDGTTNGVSWGDVSGGSGSADFSSVPDMTTESGNTWWALTSAGVGGGISLWDGANNDEIATAHEGTPSLFRVHGDLEVQGASTGVDADTVGGSEIHIQDTEPADWDTDDLWIQPQ